MDKFPKIKYPNHERTDGLKDGEVVVTEKLDGANFRFSWDDGLVIGTRNVTYELPDENLPNSFRHAEQYIRDRLDEASQVWLNAFKSGMWTLYGESMHLHSLRYDDIDYTVPEKGSPHVALDSDTPNVVLFDAKEDGDWVDWDEFCEIIAGSPFEMTKIIERGDGHGLSYEVPEESMFGGPPEGIVARRADGAIRAKKVTDDFKEKNAITFENPSKAQTDAGSFVAAYITTARIQNVAHKLVDRGEYDRVCMDMMEGGQLPRRVVNDAMGEEGWDLLSSGGFEGQWDNDFKHEARSKISTKCAQTLKDMVQNL